jgi:GTP-binding protein
MPHKAKKKRNAETPKSSAPTPDTRPGAEVARFPAVALVGRPNVGKSSIFNALLDKEVSITDKTAGTTRDRVLHPIVLNGKACDLVDTGGIGIVDRQDLSNLVEDQILAGVQTAHVLVLVVDAKEGLTPSDQHIARRLRQTGRPVVVAVNKSEGKEAGLTVGEFSALGFDFVATSALHRIGLDELGEAVSRLLPEAAKVEEDWDDLPKLAMVGRRNVGKSSFLNILAREERTIVSDVPGTTRDAVDLLMQ